MCSFVFLSQILCGQHTYSCIQKQQGHWCSVPRLEARGDLQHNLEWRKLGDEWWLDEAELDLQSLRRDLRSIWRRRLSCRKRKHRQLHCANEQLVGPVGVSNAGCSSSHGTRLGAAELPSLRLLRRSQAVSSCTTRMRPKPIIRFQGYGARIPIFPHDPNWYFLGSSNWLVCET